jgi:hypothetical protein
MNDVKPLIIKSQCLEMILTGITILSWTENQILGQGYD